VPLCWLTGWLKKSLLSYLCCIWLKFSPQLVLVLVLVLVLPLPLFRCCRRAGHSPVLPCKLRGPAVIHRHLPIAPN
jgi:hypothetical protein